MAMSTPEERARIKEKKREANRKKYAAITAKENKKSDSKAISAPLTSEANKERIQEFKRMLMHAPVGESVIRKVIDIARDDEHPGQMAAIKMCMDRLLPVSLFEEKKEGSRTAIQINICGLDESPTVIDAESVNDV